MLSESLQDLVDKRLVDRRVVPERPVRVSYSLTPWGRALEPVIESMHDWGDTQLSRAESEETAAF